MGEANEVVDSCYGPFIVRAGVVVGIAANPTKPLRAADRLAVYTVYEANVTDPEGYKNNFLKVVAPKLEKHGIRYLVRGSAPKALMGEPPKNRLVITQAKDMDTVIAFWNDSKEATFRILLPSMRMASGGTPPKVLSNRL
jgi:uncharacterized protein (DUF1330 family)